MTRAAGKNLPSDDKVENFKAFAVNGDGTLVSGYSGDGKELTKETGLMVNTRARRVYVIANAGDIELENETAVKNYIADLASKKGGLQKSARWATGSAELKPGDFKQSGSNFVASVNVQLTFIAARITVKIKSSGEMAEYYEHLGNDSSLFLQKVVVLNAGGKSKLFGKSNLPGESLIPEASFGKLYYEGMGKPDPSFIYPADDNYTVDEELFSDTVDGKFADTYCYYVFENNAKTADEFPTIVLIKGTYAKRPIYFPVHLASYENWGSAASNPEFITRGKSYEITITLKGDPRFKEGGEYPGSTGGTDDPTKPVVSSRIDVSLTLNEWVAVTLDKTFGD
ncbi:MAG: hypothetical protein LBH72_00340 [Proteiniphilum sp.]|nr:hypothetical protein [Proteiniphilum sp.]